MANIFNANNNSSHNNHKLTFKMFHEMNLNEYDNLLPLRSLNQTFGYLVIRFKILCSKHQNVIT